MNKFRASNKIGQKTKNKSNRSYKKEQKIKEDKLLDQRLEDTFPASDSTAEY